MKKDFDFEDYTWDNCKKQAFYFLMQDDIYDLMCSEMHPNMYEELKSDGLVKLLDKSDKYGGKYTEFFDKFFEDQSYEFHDYLLEDEIN